MSAPIRDLTRRWYEEIWNGRRDEAVDELLHESVVAHAEQGEMIGAELFKQVRAEFLSALPDLKFEIESLITDGDEAAVRWLATGTHTGAPLAGPPACGRKLQVRGTTWHRYEQGRLVEAWDTWNLGGLMHQVQESPSPKKKTPSLRLDLQDALARRLRELLSGTPAPAPEDGAAPACTGPRPEVTVPAELLLGLIETTKDDPDQATAGESPLPDGRGGSVIELLREALRKLEGEARAEQRADLA